MKRIVATVVCVCIFALCVYLLTLATQNQALLVIVMATCIVSVGLMWRKTKETQKQNVTVSTSSDGIEPTASADITSDELKNTPREKTQLSTTEKPNNAQIVEMELQSTDPAISEEVVAKPSVDAPAAMSVEIKRTNAAITPKEPQEIAHTEKSEEGISKLFVEELAAKSAEIAYPEACIIPKETREIEMPSVHKEKSEESIAKPSVEALAAKSVAEPVAENNASEVKPKHPYQLRLEAALTKKVTLAGTSLKARQGYLRKISEMIPPFDTCTYGINSTEFKGEPAFEVYADMMGESADKVLGFVPAKLVDEFIEIYDRIFDTEVDVYGGPDFEGDDKYFGASATFRYDPK